MSDKSKFKTLVIIDLETTGLIYDEPKITELAMIAVNIATLEQMKSNEEFPRVLNKFVKCFDPVKLLRLKVAELTGLNNRMLMDYSTFNRESVIAIEAFLSDFQKPICFVAHNGNLFDFPILFNEIKSALSVPDFYKNSNGCIDNMYLNNENSFISNDLIEKKHSSIQTVTTIDDHSQTSLFSIDCADSLNFFRQMYQTSIDKNLVISNQNCSNEPNDLNLSSNISNENNCQISNVESPVKYIPSIDPLKQKPSMKLSKIYEREFNQIPFYLKSHRAEDDCLMLLAILKRYLFQWLEWIEINHKPLHNFSSLIFPLVNNSSTVNTKQILKCETQVE